MSRKSMKSFSEGSHDDRGGVESARQIVSILASPRPDFALKETTFAALSQRAAAALDGRKHQIATNYFGQGNLEEGAFKDIDTKKKEADRLGGKNSKADIERMKDADDKMRYDNDDGRRKFALRRGSEQGDDPNPIKPKRSKFAIRRGSEQGD